MARPELCTMRENYVTIEEFEEEKNLSLDALEVYPEKSTKRDRKTKNDIQLHYL